MLKYKVKLPFAAFVEVFVEARNSEDAVSEAFNEFENYCDFVAIDFRCCENLPYFGDVESVEAIELDEPPACEVVDDAGKTTWIFQLRRF